MRRTRNISGLVMRSLVLAALVLVPTAGCKSTATRKVANAAEPGLSDPVEPGATVVAVPVRPAPAVGFVDRHPLFSKPRDYYDNSGKNKVVKVAAATVIGIPAGIFGELKQIVVGAPRPAKF